MLKNYLKIAWRNLTRHKGYAFINIFGLAMGMAGCILILLWVHDELSYDRFHKNAQQLYRIVAVYNAAGKSDAWWLNPPPVARELKETFPEVAEAAMYREVSGECLVSAQGRSFMESGGAFAEPEFLRMFSLSFIRGDSLTALDNKNGLILTESLARKYFGDEDPIGKAVQINRRYDFAVTGVIRDVPHNSHLEFRFLAPFPMLVQFWQERGMQLDLTSWGTRAFAAYAMLKKGVSLNDFNEKVRTFQSSHSDNEPVDLYLQPITDIHLHSDGIQPALHGQGNMSYVYFFSIIAVFVLVIACINFMNLTTARSAGRAKEVGLRKVVGAPRTQLVRQFFCESMVMTFLSLLFALVLVELFLPVFGELTGREITPGLRTSFMLWGGAAGISLIAGILAGLYPSLFLSSFQPADVLKGSLQSGGKRGAFRRALVVTQFTLSILLMVSTIVVSRQLAYMRHKELGFDKENVLYLPARGNLAENLETGRNELLRVPGISHVAVGSSLPTYGFYIIIPVNWEGNESGQPVFMPISSVDYEYINTLGMQVVEGRGFSREFPSDSNGVVLNEAAVQKLGLVSPLGKKVTMFQSEYTVIGVVKNYHFMPMNEKIDPLILAIVPNAFRYIFVKTAPGDISRTIAGIEAVWTGLLPEYPFEYHFLDKDYDNLYRTEMRIERVLTCFTVLAIGISCLGLFGLAAFMAEQRTKEIGVRKILGSSVTGIVLLLTREFVGWVGVSFILALPVSYYVMSRWLQGYAYRTNIGVAVFAVTALAALGIALATVSFQAIKAARANPVDSLKYE